MKVLARAKSLPVALAAALTAALGCAGGGSSPRASVAAVTAAGCSCAPSAYTPATAPTTGFAAAPSASSAPAGQTATSAGSPSAAGLTAAPSAALGAATPSSSATGAASPALTASTAPASAQGSQAPTLVAASYRHKSGTAKLGQGDLLVLAFDEPVVLAGMDPARDLALAPGDSLGQGASASVDPSDPAQVLVTLGANAVLSVFGTYSPGAAPGPGTSPATAALAPGRKPDAISSGGIPAKDGDARVIYAESSSRISYQGRVFSSLDPAQAHAYFGNLHAHTGFSDGKADPAVAWDHARGAGLDFMCVSDHLEQITDAHWTETQQIADAKNDPGHFVTIVGWEWGTGVHFQYWPLQFYNHVNLIGTTHKLNVFDVIALRDFYKHAVDDCLPDGAVGMFNHPYLVRPHLSYNNWLDYAYDARADLVLRLIHVEGHGSRQTKEIGYVPALDKGWHLSPSEVQDNHQADWGSASDRRTGVWAASLTRDDVQRALAEGRTFASDDRNATIRLMAEGSIWMGSTVARPGPVHLSVDVADPDANDGFDKLEIVSQAGQVVATLDLKGATSGHLDLAVDPAADSYFWAHAIQKDGDELFSAPIFVDR